MLLEWVSHNAHRFYSFETVFIKLVIVMFLHDLTFKLPHFLRFSILNKIIFVQMSPLVAAPLANRNQIGGTNSLHSSPPTLPSHGTLNNNCSWSASCLRPSPPLLPCFAVTSNPNSSSSVNRLHRKPMSYKDDSTILDVIEAYCSAMRPRNTVHSGKLTFDYVLV